MTQSTIKHKTKITFVGFLLLIIMRVVDFSGDNLSEVAHFVDTANGSNFWGVYLHDHPDGNTYVLGSDRHTGLRIFDTP